MTTKKEEINPEIPIAIIGMDCRMPGAANVEEFWQNLVNGVDSVSTFNDEELREANVKAEHIQSPNYVKSRGIIGNADHFDATFFGITPRDAELLDPQHRVFLECAWHALEDGGYAADKHKDRVGVYGGVGTNWHLSQVDNHPHASKHASGASIVIANDKDYLTTRVSHKLNLTGPSINVQCACSTSLVATILGMNSLRSYQCDMVLAGGATIEIPEKKGYLYQEGGMESPDGRCRPFDSQAKGTVFSRGAGVVLLKRLDDAIRDHDHIYCVIRDGAINNDGSMKAGFTAPGVQGQVAVAIEALEMAGISPESLDFVEAHGTATALGDPIEVSSLSQTFANYTQNKQFCALGSVKGNIGHTDVASGAAGLIKCALALEHRCLPASLNYDTPNPAIDFGNSPFYVNTQLKPLKNTKRPLRGLINSFGVGGTNACLILEEPPRVSQDRPCREHNVLVLSAKTETALDTLTNNIKQHLEHNPTLNLDDLAYTYQVGRKNLLQRRAIPFVDRDDLLARLDGQVAKGVVNHKCNNSDVPVVFMFPGQGNQYLGMGKDLYQTEAVFRQVVDQCCEILTPLLDEDLRDIIFADTASQAQALSKINETRITQPALFVISYAQAQLWMSWGVTPQAMIGHSVGEYVAACLAGVFSLEDALKVIARRSTLIQALPGGDMLAVLCSEEKVKHYLPATIEVATINTPELVVVSGPTGEIKCLIDTLQAQNIFCKKLDTSHAFHSAMMDQALPEFSEFFVGIKLNPPSLPIVSTVSGQWLSDKQACDPSYWVQHVRRTVRFADAAAVLLAEETPSIFLESGPGHSLESAVKAQLTSASVHAVVGSMRAGKDDGSDMEQQMLAAGRLWAAGHAPSWDKLYGEQRPYRQSLPLYPFERQKYALDFSKNRTLSVEKDKQKINDRGQWFTVPSWKRTPAATLLQGPHSDSEQNALHWLVFIDGTGLGNEICDQLTRQGKTVITVTPGDSFNQVSNAAFKLRPEVKEDYEQLLSQLKTQNIKPTRVLHLWNVGAVQGETSSFYGPLYIEQAFIKYNLLTDLRLLVAANGVYSINGEAVESPAKALAIGPCRAIGKEFPIVQARFVDVDLPNQEAQRQQLGTLLINEIQLRSEETVTAYRAGYRWSESFESVYLDAVEGLSRIKPNGVYLITGGLGGLGLYFAQCISERMPVKLVLTYRTPLPPREQWPQCLEDSNSKSTSNSTRDKIRSILALEQQGAMVMLAQADNTDEAAMAEVKANAERKFGQINGIIHSAGMAGGGIISLKTDAMADDVLSPKVKGTLLLDQLFQDSELDFMILFSSITAILGEAGRVDYCAANSFLDAFAHYRNQRQPGSTQSLNWGAWGEIGMAARWEETKASRSATQGKAKRAKHGSFLQLISKTQTEEVYDVLLDPEMDWPISDHFVLGQPTLVGTTFIELAYQFSDLKRPTDSQVCLNNVFLTSPLMFENGVAKRIRLYANGIDGMYNLSFKSQAADRNEEKDIWHEHMRAEVQTDLANNAQQVDVDALAESLKNNVDKRPFFTQVFNGETLVLELGERWQNLQYVCVGENEWLAQLNLGEHFEDDLQDYSFHPAMTDVAMAAALPLISDAPYLPFSYKEVRLMAPFSRTMWSHIRLNGNFKAGKDMVSFDITLMDLQGHELMSVEKYSLKKVTQMPSPTKAQSKTEIDTENNIENNTPNNAETPSAFSLSDDILPEEGFDAFSRILATPSLPQVVIATRNLHDLIDEAKPKVTKEKDQTEDGEAQTSGYARPSLSTTYAAPENEIEKAIAEVWQGILGIDDIGIDDDFMELGGNSLLGVQTVANTIDTFQVELSIEHYFQTPTIRAAAEAVLEQLVALTDDEDFEGLMAELEDE